MTATAEKSAVVPGKGIARNTIWNLIGTCVPLVLALFCIPPMTRGLGEARCSTLTLIWMLVGYFTILDMGIGRTLTKLAAERIARQREEELPGLFWTSCLVTVLIGAAAGIVLALLAPWLVTSRLKIPIQLQQEALHSFLAVAASLPVVVMTVGMQGMLEARQKFRLINMVRLPVGSFVFVGPLLVLPFSNSLFPVVCVLVAGRVIEWLIYFSLCLRDLPALRQGISWNRQELKPLFSTGIWINISTILMPLMLQGDRFVIGSVLAMETVLYYSYPSEMVVRLLIFPRALVSVLFPTFAGRFVLREGQADVLLARSMNWLMGLLLPVVLVVVAFTPEGLRLWLGHSFEVNSSTVMRLLTAGIFAYCLTYIPFTFLQGIGRPDITARIHLMEFPLFFVLVTQMTLYFGFKGTAVAWVIRAVLELAVMTSFAMRFAPGIRPHACRWVVCGTVAMVCFAAVSICGPILVRLGLTLISLTAWVAITWFYLFDASDRSDLQNRIRLHLNVNVTRSTP